jgi:hypothetical protein
MEPGINRMKEKPFFQIAVIGLTFFAAFAGKSYAIDLSQATFNGYLDLEYSAADNTEGNANGSFHQHHLSFLMDMPVSPKVSAFTHVEFDHGANINTPPCNTGQTGCSSFGTNGGDIVVENAFIKYVSSDALQFRFGRMLTPFGYYNEIHDATPAIISIAIPAAINRMRERGGNSMFPQWNTGMDMFGTVLLNSSPMEYSIYVGNGENPVGWNDSQVDANANKALGGRVSYQLTEGIQVGASVFNDAEAYTSGGTGGITNLQHTSGSVLLSLIGGDTVFFLSEYAVTWLDGFGRSSAGYGQFTYVFTKRFSVYYRYENTSPDDTVANAAWVEQIAGINTRPTDENNLVFKFEYSNNARGQNYNKLPLVISNPITYQNYQELRFAVALYF